MADLPISGLPPIATPGAGDESAWNQGLNSGKMSRQQLLALPSLDVSMSGTPFSTGTIGRAINATAVVTLTTFDSVQAQQTEIEDGTMWPIEAEGGIVTISAGAGVTLEFFDGSTVLTGDKDLAIGAVGVLRKVSNTVYRLTTNEAASAGGGSVPGLEVIQSIDAIISAGGTFTSSNFDVDPGDVIIFEFFGDKDNGDQTIFSFQIGGAPFLVNTTVSSAAQIRVYYQINGRIAIRASNGDFLFSVKAHMFSDDGASNDDADAFIDTAAVTTTESINIQMSEENFSDEVRLYGYIARVVAP